MRCLFKEYKNNFWQSATETTEKKVFPTLKLLLLARHWARVITTVDYNSFIQIELAYRRNPARAHQNTRAKTLGNSGEPELKKKFFLLLFLNIQKRLNRQLIVHKNPCLYSLDCLTNRVRVFPLLFVPVSVFNCDWSNGWYVGCKWGLAGVVPYHVTNVICFWILLSGFYQPLFF